jgi:hypothetical protein
MTTIIDMPSDIILYIIHQDILDLKSITNANLINIVFNKIINENFDIIIKNKFLPHNNFIKIIKDKKLSLIKSDLNINKLFNLLNTLEYVYKFKKKKKYQHLLTDFYNSSIFNIKHHKDSEEQNYFESVTLRILMALLDYVKANLDITKTDLSPWILYCILDYIATIINTDNRVENTIFLKNDMHSIMINRLYFITRELKKIKNCHIDIKLRLRKTINYLSEVYDEIIHT